MTVEGPKNVVAGDHSNLHFTWKTKISLLMFKVIASTFYVEIVLYSVPLFSQVDVHKLNSFLFNLNTFFYFIFFLYFVEIYKKHTQILLLTRERMTIFKGKKKHSKKK